MSVPKDLSQNILEILRRPAFAGLLRMTQNIF